METNLKWFGTGENTVEVMSFEEMSKVEMLDHLRVFHARAYSSMTKAELIRQHDRLHNYLAKSYWDASRELWVMPPSSEHPNGSSTRAQEHRHYVLEAVPTVELTEEERKSIPSLDNLTKPLTATEMRLLNSLINNDFNTLAREIDQFGHDLLRERLDAVEKESEKLKAVAEQYLTKAKAMQAKQEEQLRALEAKQRQEREDFIRKAEADQIQIDGLKGPRYGETPRANIPSVMAARSRVEKETKTEIQGGKIALEKERQKELRKVLMAGLPTGTTALVEALPSANEIMQQAMAERAAATERAKAITDGAN